MTKHNETYASKVARLDWNALREHVGGRIAALQLTAVNLQRIEGSTPEMQEAMCRDLIWPCVELLATFLQSVQEQGT